MPDQNDEGPQIIVDSDWKEQARREKEELDRQSREEPARGGALPAPSLAEIVQMVVIQASLGLGGFQDPNTGQVMPPNMAVAKHYIDLLELFLNKTASNLDQNEKGLIEGTLHELRMAFVQVAGLGAGGPQEPGQP